MDDDRYSFMGMSMRYLNPVGFSIDISKLYLEEKIHVSMYTLVHLTFSRSKNDFYLDVNNCTTRYPTFKVGHVRLFSFHVGLGRIGIDFDWLWI